VRTKRNKKEEGKERNKRQKKKEKNRRDGDKTNIEEPDKQTRNKIEGNLQEKITEKKQTEKKRRTITSLSLS